MVASNQSPSLQSSPVLRGDVIAFTGTLASMTHRNAFAVVEEHGGVAAQHVSKKTTLLVVGEEGWPLEADGQPSQKLQQFTALQEEDDGRRLLSESDWLFLVGLESRRREIRNEQTPAMLSQLLDVPVNVIRGWKRMGLIRAVRTVGRLPYFDFQEVAGARRLVELLAAGVPENQLKAGLQTLEKLLPGTVRPLSQFEILVQNSRLLYRDERGLIDPISQQRCFDFGASHQTAEANELGETTKGVAAETDLPVTLSLEKSRGAETISAGDDRLQWTATEWFHEGCRLLDDDCAASAVEAFRLSLMDRPGDAVTHFSLGEALYRLGNSRGALERYYAAVECDHHYLEAWMQIGSLHAESDDFEAAVQAFEVALSIDRDCPDAHWHKADLLCRLGRSQEAVPHWEAYLQHDTRGPWAESARQHLAEISE